jgi:hypothetical protein
MCIPFKRHNFNKQTKICKRCGVKQQPMKRKERS